ncbi:MAG: YjgP/YjgQ family permease [Flavobacteriales bacterium]|jgi:lipopolysaccharide export system permease protein|nr:YjgP/YjgQ family permease [Flavobacteriales bacterium]
MKRLHLFLIKSFIGSFIATFFIAIFLLLMQFLWKYIDDLVGKGLEFTQIAELIFYASTRFVPVALPIAMLLSSVMVFGKLGENYELAALKASGISLIRMLFPLTIFVIIISYSSFLFSNYIMPIANLKNGSMIYDIQKKKPALNIKEGIFYNDIEGFSIKVTKKNTDGKTLKNIIIYDHTANNGNDKIIIAESGTMQLTKDEQFLELILYNGHSYIDIAKNNRKAKKPYRTTHFKEDLIRFNLSSFSTMKNSENLYKGHYAMLSNKQLAIAIDSLNLKFKEREKAFTINIIDKYNSELEMDSLFVLDDLSLVKQKQQFDIAINKLRTIKSILKSNKDDLEYRKIIITKHEIEWHRKISLAVACLLLFLIGSSMGAIIRKGGFGLPVLISVFFFLIYHVLSMIGEKSAKDLSMHAYEGIWLANIIFLPIALFLVYKAKNDSQLLDLSSVFKRIIPLVKKRKIQ